MRPTVIAQLEEILLGTRRALLGHDSAWQPLPFDAACPRCGRTVGVGEVSPDDGRCGGCRAEKIRWQRLIQLGQYEGDLRQAIVETKYGPWRAQGNAIGRRIGERIVEALQGDDIDPKRTLLIPAPMPAGRRFRRGIDHTEVIARAAGKTAGIPVQQLLRKRPGPTQASVPHSQRTASIRNRIEAVRSLDEHVELVILIDDVTTTGATLDACCRALAGEQTGRTGRRRRTAGERHPVRASMPAVWAAVAAVVPASDRRPKAAVSARTPAVF